VSKKMPNHALQRIPIGSGLLRSNRRVLRARSLTTAHSQNRDQTGGYRSVPLLFVAPDEPVQNERA